jgi:ABC-2 type transport system ATP-binding protein
MSGTALNKPVLQVTAARRAFAERQALQDVSLTLRPGEIIALLGPNGAGKTTLMRAIAGRLKLDSGAVSLCGQDPYLEPSARAKLGIVPQTIALYPALTPRQNLDIFARLAGLRGAAIKAAVAEALARAQLADRADEALHGLSGGMQRRLNIVAGTLQNPVLLLLDEPTVGVDLDARQTIHALLQDLRDAGMAILVSTHDFEQASAIADRVAFMAGGKLLADGPVAALVHQVFGDAKEGVVAFSSGVGEKAGRILSDFGFRATSDTRLWSGPVTGGYQALAELEKELETSGVHVAELRLRDPDLNGVFMHLTELCT